MATFNVITDNINYEVYQPSGNNKKLFKNFVEIKGTPSFSKERIISANGPELIINLNETLFGKFHNTEESIQQSEYVINGNRFNYFESIIPNQAHYIVIKFTNYGFNRLIKIPLNNLSNIQIKNLKEKRLKEMISRLSAAKEFHEKVKIFHKWIDKVYEETDKFVLGELMEKILLERPESRSGDLVKLTGYSSKYLNKKFKEYSGYTISNFKRLSRFHKSLNQLRNHQDIPWAELVYTSDYYDQSHFIKELGAFTGLTPSMLRENMKKNFHNFAF